MIREYVYQACLGNSFNPCSFGSADLERIFYQYDALCSATILVGVRTSRLSLCVPRDREAPWGTFKLVGPI